MIFRGTKYGRAPLILMSKYMEKDDVGQVGFSPVQLI
jgi:hypothetical protein